jgi:hypothetical protein
MAILQQTCNMSKKLRENLRFYAFWIHTRNYAYGNDTDNMRYLQLILMIKLIKWQGVWDLWQLDSIRASTTKYSITILFSGLSNVTLNNRCVRRILHE